MSSETELRYRTRTRLEKPLDQSTKQFCKCFAAQGAGVLFQLINFD